MSKQSGRCFGCSEETSFAELALCLHTKECIWHRGPMCNDCMQAHLLSSHDGFERPAQEYIQ